MTKNLFSKQQQAQLKLNPYVKTVSAKAITYTDEFKEFFIDEYDKGKYPSEIFLEAGFDIEALGPARIRRASNRWRTAYKEHGLTGLEDARKHASGRPLERELTLEEKYTRLEAKMKLLEAENEFLKKLDQLERQMMRQKSK
ncbi:HTH domain-containing protein [Lysinibacillus xylanilyticus]|uniref:HTH domain-containing protein n=1 Tax=Lysinibacillus xylanilyticus TaxID=582475 RepID=UPI003CFCE76E